MGCARPITLPPLGFAAALPVSRQRRTQLITELGLTSKCSATSRREAPDLTSSIARSRKSPEYGLGIEFPPANQTAVGRIVHCSDVGNPLRFDHTGIRSSGAPGAGGDYLLNYIDNLIILWINDDHLAIHDKE